MSTIRKAKMKDNNVEIHAGKRREDGGEDKFTILKSTDQPLQEFRDAFVGLVKHVRHILEIRADQWENMISVTGVSWSTSEEGVEGVVITSLVQLVNVQAPIVLNTPHMPVEQYSTAGQDALDAVKRHAEDYFHGKRQQGELFEEAA